MKIIIICCFFLSTSIKTFPQKDTIHSREAHNYFKKSKTEKLIGYPFLAVGTYLLIKSIPKNLGDYSWDFFGGDLGYDPQPVSYKNNDNILLLVGIGVMISASVLLYYARHHRKTAILLLKNEKGFISPKMGIENIPSIGFKISL